MSEVISVRTPQETVNDDFVLIRQWNVIDGQAVRAGQLLVELESSKSVFEITSPADGYVRLNAAADQEVPIGAVLCFVGTTLDAVDATREVASRSAPVSSVSEPAISSPTTIGAKVNDVAAIRDEAHLVSAQSTRFSRAAMQLIQQHSLSITDFAGRGLVRRADVVRAMSNALASTTGDTIEENSQVVPAVATQTTPAANFATAKSVTPFRPAAGATFRLEPLARSKKLETHVLSWSTLQVIRSSVTVTVPTLGRCQLLELDGNAAEKLTGNLIRSCAQLLRQYPLLNACCLDNQVMIYEPVHVGYAIDAGQGLKVAVLRNADQKTMAEIVDDRSRLVDAYLNESLRPVDLSGATFTITDLSGSGVTTFDPIISEGQGGILGICGETPAASGQQAFQLVLSFDHRLVEGRVAASFLNHLKEQSIAFERSIVSTVSSSRKSVERCCVRCGQSVTEAAGRNHFLVSVAGKNNENSLVCTICLQGR